MSFHWFRDLALAAVYIQYVSAFDIVDNNTPINYRISNPYKDRSVWPLADLGRGRGGPRPQPPTRAVAQLKMLWLLYVVSNRRLLNQLTAGFSYYQTVHGSYKFAPKSNRPICQYAFTK